MYSKNWKNSDYAEQFFQREQPLLSAGLRQAVGPKTLQIDDLIDSRVVLELDLPFCVTAYTTMPEKNDTDNRDIDAVVDPAFLPFSPDSLSTVILPHVLEWHDLPHQVLREVHRVLMSEGHVVLTGFNPASLLGLQSMFQYAPLSKSPRIRKTFGFLESVGDRWLPMTGGGYMIVAKKREIGINLIGRAKFSTPKVKLATASVRAPLKKHDIAK